jgi:hypothetical protein
VEIQTSIELLQETRTRGESHNSRVEHPDHFHGEARVAQIITHISTDPKMGKGVKEKKNKPSPFGRFKRPKESEDVTGVSSRV